MIRRKQVGTMTLAVIACLAGACDDENDYVVGDDGDLWIECLEPRGNARGALLEFRWMLQGREPVDTTTLEIARTFMRQLAGVVSASEAVRQDIDRWEAAIGTWQEGLYAIEPQIVHGRFVEPDTTVLDRRLLDELTPLAERLGAWVETACKTPRPETIASASTRLPGA